MDYTTVITTNYNSLPLNSIELEAGELALEQAKKYPSVIEATKAFSSALTYYGVPFYKHADLVRFYLVTYFEENHS